MIIPRRLLPVLESIGSAARGAILSGWGRTGQDLLLLEPDQWFEASTPVKAVDVLSEMEAARKSHLLAGWLAYDLGVPTEAAPEFRGSGPLLEFGAYTRTADPSKNVFQPASYRLSEFRFDWSRTDYLGRVDRILTEIGKGNVYQVNFTLRLRFRFEGDPRSLFVDLHRSQPARYSALLRNREQWVLSFSPELFLEWQGVHARMRPMKGTAPRGRFEREDRERAAWLQNDSKSRAENLMIVDLIRNDLGRVAEYGSVKVPRRYQVESLPTLIQMTSTVEAQLRPNLSLLELLKAVFPCGSVTGAPKLAAMRLISELESEPRGVYCGALGAVGRDWGRLSVAIRTLSLRKVSPPLTGESARIRQPVDPLAPDGCYDAVLGIGSGIVADSVPQQEWEESRLKASFVTSPAPPFELIETLLSRNGEPLRLEAHLNRMEQSALYFGFPFCREVVRRRIMTAADRAGSRPHRLRALLAEAGEVRVESAPLEPLLEPVGVALSTCRVDSENRFQYHKTTHRPLYDDAHKEAERSGLWDFIFQNERLEITEGSICSLFIRIGQRWWTPPLKSGILPGIMRGQVIEELKAEERSFGEGELREADEIVVTNSVRGRLRARLVE